MNARAATGERLAICHHEAGHAVVATVLGIQVLEVSVKATEDSLGRCTINRRGIDRESAAIALMAGSCAVKRYKGPRGIVYIENGDYMLLYRYLAAPGTSEEAFLEQVRPLHMKALDLVEAHWVWITAAAQRLSVLGAMTGADLCALNAERESCAAEGR